MKKYLFIGILLCTSCISKEQPYEYTGNDSIKIATIKEFEELGFTIVKNKKGNNPMEIPEDTLDLFVAFKKYHQNMPKVDTSIVFQTTVEETIDETIDTNVTGCGGVSQNDITV